MIEGPYKPNRAPEQKAGMLRNLNSWKPTEDEAGFIKTIIMPKYFRIAENIEYLIGRTLYKIKIGKLPDYFEPEGYFESVDGQESYERPPKIQTVNVVSKTKNGTYGLTLWHRESTGGYGRPIIIEDLNTEDEEFLFKLDLTSPGAFRSKEEFNEKIEELNRLLEELGFAKLLNIEKDFSFKQYIPTIPN